jgi:hypothetical protein
MEGRTYFTWHGSRKHLHSRDTHTRNTRQIHMAHTHEQPHHDAYLCRAVVEPLNYLCSSSRWKHMGEYNMLYNYGQ